MNTQLQDDTAEKTQEPVSTKKRPPFMVTYLMGAVTFTGILILWYDILFRSGVPEDINIIRLVAGSVVYGIIAILTLPYGLFLAFAWILEHEFGIRSGEGGWKFLWIFLSYSLFFFIPGVSLKIEKERTLRILYFIFIGLIIISAAGCLGNATAWD